MSKKALELLNEKFDKYGYVLTERILLDKGFVMMEMDIYHKYYSLKELPYLPYRLCINSGDQDTIYHVDSGFNIKYSGELKYLYNLMPE